MSLSALFFNFSKRNNSTKVPVDNTGTVFDVTLKQPCSYEEPVLTLSNSGFSYNYAKFEGSYYFLTDKVSLRANLWEIHLKKDVLASHRTGLLSQNAYVLYDATGNGNIVDTRLAVTTVPTVDSASAAFPGVDPSIGRYILTVVGQNSCIPWAIPYRMNPASVINSIYYQNVYNSIDEQANPWSDSSTDYVTAIQEQSSLIDKIYAWAVPFQKKAWSQTISSGDALSAVRSCIWLPFNFSTDATDAGIIYLGNYDTQFAGIKMGTPSNPAVKTLPAVTVNIPWQFSDFRRNSPYTEIYLYIPFIGVVQLSASSLIGAANLTVTASLNILSGDLSARVSCGSQTIGTYGANIAVDVPIGSAAPPVGKMTTTLLSSVAATGLAAASGNALAFGAAAIAGIVANSTAGLSTHPTSIGGLSGGAGSGLLTDLVCFTVCHDTVVAPSSVAATIGRPSYAVKTLSTLTGYCQTAEFSFEGPATDRERAEINRLMNSGVFIE